MSDRPQPSGADDGLADIVGFVTHLRLAGVHRHAYTDRVAQTLGPRLAGQGLLRLHRGLQGVRRPAEGADDGVTLALFLRPHPTVGGHRPVKDLVVAGDRHAHKLGRRLPSERGPLHVGQEERHRANRQGELVVA